MPVRYEEDWEAFDEAMEGMAGAVALTQVRAETIVRGRATLRLFEPLGPDAGSRPHLRLNFTELDDPEPPRLPTPPDWADAGELRVWLASALVDPRLSPDPSQAPGESPRYWRNAIRGMRVTALLDRTRAAIDARVGWSEAERDAAHYAVTELGALAFTGWIAFDDDDTGTYHSFLHDQPFVHVLEALLASLPEPDSEALALVPEPEREAIERQRRQLRNHLDFLMRHKYAYTGIVETDIERSLGGRLIDRESRQVVSEDPATRDSLQPRHQLLRVDPASEDPLAGEWLVATAGGYALADGTEVEVDPGSVEATPVRASQLTFERAPNDPRLRRGVRFDWNGDGLVEALPLPWIAWAGHCDVKAVLEALGLALHGQPSVHEYRSDTGEITELDRKLLLELLTGVVELGSVYLRLDGGGTVVRGQHGFGGSRNDSLPDRLQFDGAGPDQYFRWPIERDREGMQVTRLIDDGEPLDPDAALARYHPDLDAIDFAPNPRYLGTVDGDYNLIDATEMVVEAEVRVSRFDAQGNLVHGSNRIRLDLGPDARGRTLLGTQLRDPGARELYRVYLDHEQPAILAELWRWDRASGAEQRDPSGDLSLALAAPLATTLSREQRLDDPTGFTELIDLAVRRGQNICADTDDQAPVWNGVVTAMRVERIAVNPAARVERWQIGFEARFGRATLDQLLRRGPDGSVLEACPVAGGYTRSPDFVWQDLPEVAPTLIADGRALVNQAMVERGLIDLRWDPAAADGWTVADEHLSHCFELLYAALAGYRWTIVHQNRRWAFTDEAAWDAARAELDQLRAALESE